MYDNFKTFEDYLQKLQYEHNKDRQIECINIFQLSLNRLKIMVSPLTDVILIIKQQNQMLLNANKSAKVFAQ